MLQQVADGNIQYTTAWKVLQDLIMLYCEENINSKKFCVSFFAQYVMGHLSVPLSTLTLNGLLWVLIYL